MASAKGTLEELGQSSDLPHDSQDKAADGRAAGRSNRPGSRSAASRAVGLSAGRAAGSAIGAVCRWVERFDRRGTEPFELLASEFGQNSFKIQEFSLENSKISEIFNI